MGGKKIMQGEMSAKTNSCTFVIKPELLFFSKCFPKCTKWHSRVSRETMLPDPPTEMGFPSILIRWGNCQKPNAECRTDCTRKSPKQAKPNRSAIQVINRRVACTQVSLKSTLVSLNIAQICLKKAHVSLLLVSSQ